MGFKWIRWMIVVAGVAGCSVKAAEEVALPVPTGPHGVGRAEFHWVDETREELATKAAGDKRELLVYVFYPTGKDASGTRASYMPEAGKTPGVWSDVELARIARVRGHSREGVRVANGRFPAVVFAPGNGFKTLVYTSLLEDLASHGYVIAAIEPAHNAPAIRFPDGRVLTRASGDERGWGQPRGREENMRFYARQVEQWAQDIRFVLDRLAVLDRADGIFAGKIDATRAGAFGHSRGGQAAGTARLLDSRVRGAVNLDGNMMGRSFQYLGENEEGGTQPFLWLHTPLERPSDEEMRRAGKTEADFRAVVAEVEAMVAKQLGSVKGGALRVAVNRPGIRHMDFSDLPLWSLSEGPARKDKERTLARTRKYVREFFAGTVRDDWSGWRDALARAKADDPELQLQAFGGGWAEGK